MEHYYIIKIKGWTVDYFKGTDSELEEQLALLGIKITKIIGADYNDLRYNFNRKIKTQIEVIGYDKKYFDSLCKQVEEIIGTPIHESLRIELNLATKKKIVRKIVSDDALYILSSDKDRRTDGVGWIGSRDFKEMSDFSKEWLDDHLSHFGMRLP